MDAARLIAHRGWQRRFPENTLPALQGALDAGALNVEIDVQLTADHQPVLFHDLTLRRICRQPGAIHRYSREQLRLFSAYEPERFGDRFLGTPIAHLDEVVALLLQRYPQAHLFLELKRVSVQAFDSVTVCDAVAAAVTALGARCTVISFDIGVLQEAARRGWRVGPVLEQWGQIDAAEVAALNPAVVFVDARLLPADLASVRWPLAVYEVNQPDQVRALWARGVQLVESFAVGELLQHAD
jgi:glycerophosphoryl diester phosphodiesterase